MVNETLSTSIRLVLHEPNRLNPVGETWGKQNLKGKYLFPILDFWHGSLRKWFSKKFYLP